MKLGNLEVCIESGGQRLEEYSTETDGRQISCWVASEAGQSFSFTFEDTIHATDMLCDTYLDGVQFPGSVSVGSQKQTKSYYLDNTGRRRDILFSPVSLSDDDELMGRSNQSLGTIKLVLHRVQVLGTTMGHPAALPSKGSMTVHERSKKMASHSIALAAPAAHPPSMQSYSTTRKLNREEDAVTFLFTYRKKDILIASGLIPSAQPAERESPAPVRVKPEKKKAAPKQNTKKLQPQGANKRKSWRGDDGIEVINLSDSDSEAIVKKEKKRVKKETTEVIDLSGL